jgi:hypothetical protein
MPATLRRTLATDQTGLASQYWGDGRTEPALSEVLADPIVRALMRADNLRAQDVLATLARADRPASPRSAAATGIPGQA